MEKGYEEATGQVRIEPDDSKEFEVKDKIADDVDMKKGCKDAAGKITIETDDLKECEVEGKIAVLTIRT